MKSISPFVAALMSLFILSGCAATIKNLQRLVASPADLYREKALACEKADEPRKALFFWDIAAHLDQKDTGISKSIANLKRTTTKAARIHLQKGTELYRAGDLNDAMRAFLIALRLDPNLDQARDYLKNRLQNPEQAIYRVQPGDSFIKIANDKYKDPSKAYLIAYFNDMDPKKPLLIGTHLSLPAFEDEYLIPRSDIKNMLEKAQAAYEHKHYGQVYALTDAIMKEIPDHAKARKLADAAHFDQGTAMMDRMHYLAAIEQFKQISDRYKGRDRAMAKARSRIKRQAIEEKLKAARTYLNQKEWPGVINVAEEILAQDPDNDQAKMLFSNASYKLGKRLLDRGETIKAIDVLRRIEPTYEDTGQLLALARARIKAQAEALYRDGVKQFINEDLEKAIKTWKRTLELNPDHPKARQDMENAQRLLEKLRSLDNDKSKTGE